MENLKEIDLSNYIAKTKPEQSLKEHTEEVEQSLEVLKNLNYVLNKHIYQLTKIACHYHDYGKMNTQFQARIKSNGKIKFNIEKEIPHSILSVYFLNEEEIGEDYYKIAYAILRHHNNYMSYDEEEIMRERTDEIKQYLSEFPLNIVRMKRRIINMILDMNKNDEAIWIKGLLHRCDYSASAGLRVEYENDFLKEKMKAYMSGWEKNELQSFCEENTERNIIIKAQTGMGKTEAGLLWLGNSKGFFVLPLKVAINAIYDRVRNNILNGENIAERLGLLHSDTISCYLDRSTEDDDIEIKEYVNRTKQLSMPLTVATLDQLFDFVFKSSGYEMKLITLAYSKIIIDEIQMYSPDLLAYLVYGISQIYRFGGKVAILTATLAPFVRDLLVQDAFSNDVVENTFTQENQSRHRVKVVNDKLNTEVLIRKYQENKKLNKPNKILVVCNTVKKSQEIYEELREFIDEDELFLLHKKFIEKERTEKEQKILEFGKTYAVDGSLDKRDCIWITTSIVEASLDIDFDILFTELQDLNSFFQRLGRCNRKGVKDLSDYNCYVYLKINEQLLRNGDRGFIDKKIYELSKLALQEFDEGLLTEEKKMEMIDTYFTTEQVKLSDFMKEYKDTYERIKNIEPDEIEKTKSKIREIISYKVIPKNIYEEHEEEIEENVHKLSNKNLDYKDRIDILQKIDQYTLSVESYIYRSSEIIPKNIFKNQNYTEIGVIDCRYDELGFRKADRSGYEIW